MTELEKQARELAENWFDSVVGACYMERDPKDKILAEAATQVMRSILVDSVAGRVASFAAQVRAQTIEDCALIADSYDRSCEAAHIALEIRALASPAKREEGK